MKLKFPKELTTVTPLSKILALIVFLTALIIAFFLGMQYQETIFTQTIGQDSKTCTQEAKLCPDGSYVSRQGPNCEFTSCPKSQ